MAISITMGYFSVTQMQYQHRMNPIRELFRGIFSFTKGFLGWFVLFPYGIKNGKYKMKVTHKVGNTNPNI